MTSHQPPRVPTWEERTPAERARITRLTREADARNAQDDLEPSDADKEATTRAVFEQDLRSAYAQWSGHGARASKTFDQWLRTEATEHPALMNEADAVIQAQDAERAAKSDRAAQALDTASQHLSRAIEALQDANRHGNAVESLLIIPLIRAAVDTRNDADRLRAAKNDSDE